LGLTCVLVEMRAKVRATQLSPLEPRTAPSCPAQARMIDFPHGQEKISRQKEIGEETRAP
jgi:hypothetical protein